jgi:hypothetical protein
MRRLPSTPRITRVNPPFGKNTAADMQESAREYLEAAEKLSEGDEDVLAAVLAVCGSVLDVGSQICARLDAITDAGNPEDN